MLPPSDSPPVPWTLKLMIWEGGPGKEVQVRDLVRGAISWNEEGGGVPGKQVQVLGPGSGAGYDLLETLARHVVPEFSLSTWRVTGKWKRKSDPSFLESSKVPEMVFPYIYYMSQTGFHIGNTTKPRLAPRFLFFWRQNNILKVRHPSFSRKSPGNTDNLEKNLFFDLKSTWTWYPGDPWAGLKRFLKLGAGPDQDLLAFWKIPGGFSFQNPPQFSPWRILEGLRAGRQSKCFAFINKYWFFIGSHWFLLKS